MLEGEWVSRGSGERRGRPEWHPGVRYGEMMGKAMRLITATVHFR